MASRYVILICDALRRALGTTRIGSSYHSFAQMFCRQSTPLFLVRVWAWLALHLRYGFLYFLHSCSAPGSQISSSRPTLLDQITLRDFQTIPADSRGFKHRIYISRIVMF